MSQATDRATPADRWWSACGRTNPLPMFGDMLDHCMKVSRDDWLLRGIRTSVHLSGCPCGRHIAPGHVRVSLDLVACAHRCARDGIGFGRDPECADSQVALIVEARGLRQALLFPMPFYSRLDWDEVLVRAEGHGVKCVCDRERGAIALRLVPDAYAMAARPA